MRIMPLDASEVLTVLETKFRNRIERYRKKYKSASELTKKASHGGKIKATNECLQDVVTLLSKI